MNNPIDFPVPGLMNLRQAIDTSNAAPAGADTIQFAAALYGLGGGTATVLVSDTLPTIIDDLTIDGTSGVAGQRVVVMPLNAIAQPVEGPPVNPPQFRLFQVATPGALLPVRVDVTFKALTMTGGNATNPADPNGGAVAMANATVTLNNCFVTGNSAAGNGGGVWATGNPSLLVLTNNSVVSNNTAAGNGGGISVTNTSLLVNVGTQVTNNRAGLGGGGIAAFADGYVGIAGVPFVELNGSEGLVQVNDNTAMSGDGGGVLVQESNTAGVVWPDVIFNHTSVNYNTARGTAPLAGGDWESGRGGGVAAIGMLTVDSDTNTVVTENKQSAPAPGTAPFKLGVYLDTPLLLLSTFDDNANVFDNEQLP